MEREGCSIYSSISDTYFENKKPVVSVIFLYNISTNGYNQLSYVNCAVYYNKTQILTFIF